MIGMTNAIGEALPEYITTKGLDVLNNEFTKKITVNFDRIYALSDNSPSSMYLNPNGGNVYLGGNSVYSNGSVLYGAAWNDYAEYRELKESIQIPFGRCVCENGDDTVSVSTRRMQEVPYIVSDTFGFIIGENSDNKVPVAVSGRVLVYTLEDRNTFSVGDAVCAAENGTVSKMSREEVKEFPDRIVGVVCSVPDYDVWGENKVDVNGRIWVKVK